MPSFTSPVSLARFQTYLNDTSTDTPTLDYYQSLLDNTTEQVYTFLDRDFTASAEKTDVFIGDNSECHTLHEPAGALVSWKTVDREGTIVTRSITSLALFLRGTFVGSKDDIFSSEFEHQITYTLPVTLTCPETIQQVIIEIAAVVLRESKQGGSSLGEVSAWFRENDTSSQQHFYELAIRHRQLLSPYRRYAI